MERAIRVVSVERGHDPRRFALVAFGGAGGMHACDIARKLDIATVVVPRHAGVLSALGMLVADVTRDFSASVLLPVDRLTLAELRARLQPLAARAAAELAREGFPRRRMVLEPQIDVRYIGQSFEITVPFTPDFRREFDRRHRRLYGYANPARAAEVVAVRVRAAGVTEKPTWAFRRPKRRTSPRPASIAAGRFDGRSFRVALYRWPDLEPGAAGRGPAVITGAEATAVIPPGFRFRIDGFGNVIASES
jgi:N-methylhydantoinase A/oxoprolinase/acetone carboxylase beta subunit